MVCEIWFSRPFSRQFKWDPLSQKITIISLNSYDTEHRGLFRFGLFFKTLCCPLQRTKWYLVLVLLIWLPVTITKYIRQLQHDNILCKTEPAQLLILLIVINNLQILNQTERNLFWHQSFTFKKNNFASSKYLTELNRC